jgi:polyhydroxyalkanoate synthesis regulator phasin
MVKKGKSEAKGKYDHGLFDLSRKILLASIGAAALAEEEISGFIDRMAERGEIAEKDARKLFEEVMEKREGVLHDKLKEVRKRSPISLATREDIDTLQKKVDELSKKLDELKKQESKE